MEYPQVGCVIMASGMARRFGSNKLLADFDGEAMICRILRATQGLFARRVVVTRHEEVASLCQTGSWNSRSDPGSLDKCDEKDGLDEPMDLRDLKVVLHDRPGRNDTVRLGMEALGHEYSHVIFCQSDQPLLRRDSIKRLVEAGLSGGKDVLAVEAGLSGDNDVPIGEADCLKENMESLQEKRSKIYRLAYGDQVGAPVLFPAWTFPELMDLPEKKGGGFLIKKYPEWVDQVEADSPYELKDVDRPEDLEELLEVWKKTKP